MAPITPRPVNCPTVSSMNSRGMPQMKRVMKYGNRKTPGRKNVNWINPNLWDVARGNVWLRSIKWSSMRSPLTHLRRFCTWCKEISRRSTAPPSSRCRPRRIASCCSSADVAAWGCCHRRQRRRSSRYRRDPRVVWKATTRPLRHRLISKITMKARLSTADVDSKGLFAYNCGCLKRALFVLRCDTFDL